MTENVALYSSAKIVRNIRYCIENFRR